jgi:glycosyltransferase involved in cell wall biosynthesis
VNRVAVPLHPHPLAQMDGRPLRILMDTSTWIPCPPDVKREGRRPNGYGGIEWMATTLTEELAAQGVEVIHAGAPGSAIKGVQVTYSLPLTPPYDPYEHIQEEIYRGIYLPAAHQRLVEEVAETHAVDLVHTHGFPFEPRCYVPSLSTLHGPLDGTDLDEKDVMLQEAIRQAVRLTGRPRVQGDLRWYNFISRAQSDTPEGEILRLHRTIHPWNSIYNAVHLGRIRECQAPAQIRFVNFGRIESNKGQHIIAEVCRRRGWRLDLYGHVTDQAYFDNHVKPHLGAFVQYHGPIEDIAEALEEATAFLFPIQWEEPFGMVLIEAMACGVPVIAFKRGAAPELGRYQDYPVEQRTGLIAPADDHGAFERLIEEAIELAWNRPGIRRFTLETYGPKQMALNYLGLYRSMLEKASHF